MAKELTEMTLEELWRLFPIVLKEYNPQYPQWYEQEKEELEAIFAEDALVRISHIGSTSVPGLLSKPIIDILVELSAIADVPIWKKKLEDSGWLCMSQERAPEYKLAFNKGYTPVGFDEKVM